MAVQLSNKVRIIFFLSQLVYMAFGAAMFAIGIYSIVNLQRFGTFTENTYVAGSALFIGAGTLKFVFGLMGILVLFWQKKPLIMIFTVGVILLMMITFAAGIYGFIARPGAYFTSRDRVTDAFADTDANQDDIDNLRDELGEPNCNDQELPSNETLVLRQPCYVFLAREIQQDLYVVGAVGIGFGTSELTGLLIAMQNFEGL